MSNVAHDLSVLYILIEDLSKDYFHLLRAKGCRRNRCLVYVLFLFFCCCLGDIYIYVLSQKYTKFFDCSFFVVCVFFGYLLGFL